MQKNIILSQVNVTYSSHKGDKVTLSGLCWHPYVLIIVECDPCVTSFLSLVTSAASEMVGVLYLKKVRTSVEYEKRSIKGRVKVK